MSRADDLSSLLRPDNTPALAFRQGTVITWNYYSGSGTVSVGGTVLVDVPFMSLTGSVILLPGDSVILLRQGSSWFILGQIQSPGGVAGIGRNTQATLGLNVVGSNFALTTSQVTQVDLPIVCPLWAEALTVSAHLQVFAKNSTGATDLLEANLILPDAVQIAWPSDSVPTLLYGSANVELASTFHVTPGSTVHVLGQVRAVAAGWAINAQNRALISATVTFNSSG